MTRPLPPIALLAVALALLAAPACLAQTTTAPARPVTDDAAFDARLDLRPLGTLAVQAEGRLKSFESFATSMMRFVSGPHRPGGRSVTHLYLDLLLRPHAYHDEPIVHVRKRPIRVQIAQALRRSVETPDPALETQIDDFLATGLIAPRLLDEPEVRTLLRRLSSDLIRTAKAVDRIDTALAVMAPRTLLSSWRAIPPSRGDDQTPWLSFDELLADRLQPAAAPPDRIDPDDADAALAAWEDLVNGWLLRDADAVNGAVATLATTLPAINPDLYPSPQRLRWESFYFRSYNLTWLWIFYALSLIPLLLDVVFRWRPARVIGIGMFVVAFALHTGALLLRWYVSERWPNSNMFEAVTTAAWFGGCAAIVLEILVRRTRMRNLFALGSAVASMVALMCAYYLPLHLDAGIENRMPVLHDVWLYIHTNVIIFSYCLIAMAAVSAVLYLLYRAYTAWQGRDGRGDFARVGGAGTLIMAGPDGGGIAAGAGTSARSAGLGAVLDGTTMILLELSFVMLWAGLVMGAIWADHSWGRPWGWDPKEVFALNTFIVFAVLIHVRMRSRDKGLWTAWIALFGAGVMLFNWIAINFVITGLHSYA